MKRFCTLFLTHALQSIIIALLSFIPIIMQAEVMKATLDFEIDTTKIISYNFNDVEYIRIVDGQSNYLNTPEAPELPVKYFNISVPYNAQNFVISNCDCLNDTVIPLQAKIMPIRRSQKMSSEIYSELKCNDSIYSLSSYFPQEYAFIHNQSYLNGFNKIITIGVCPFLYYPRYDKIIALKNLELTIDYDMSETSDQRYIDNDLSCIIPANSYKLEQLLTTTKENVINPEDVERNLPPKANMVRISDKQVAQNEYNYIIVTSKKFSEPFAKLAAIRALKGYKSKIFLIEDILNDERFADGDEVSGLNDDAGKLRAFLRYAWANYNTEYVLLGGKEPDLPIRKSENIDNEPFPTTTDLYFSDLNNDWSNSCYENFVSIANITDFDCELYVGRLCCTSTQDVYNYIEKLWEYEFPNQTDTSTYYLNAQVSVFWNLAPDFTQYLKPYYEELFNVHSMIQTSVGDNFPSGNDVINDLNSNQYGFVDFVGHGNPLSVGVSGQQKVKMWGVTSINSVKGGLKEENNNGLDCWKNKYTPAWSLSFSCSTMPFLDFSHIPGYEDVKQTFVESFLFGKNYGGVAFIGNTNLGWTGNSSRINSTFLKNLISKRDNKQIALAGELTAVARRDTKVSNIYSKVLLRYNLCGDPALPLWTELPQNISTNYYDKSYWPILPDTLQVSIVSLHHPNSPQKIIIPGEEMLPYWVSKDNQIYTIFGSNLKPVIYPAEINNCSFNDQKYIIARDIIFGNENEVVFGSNSDICIDCDQHLELNRHTKILSGAKIKLVSKKEILLSGVKVPAGATLIVEAPSLSMDKHTSIDENAIFLMINNTDM